MDKDNELLTKTLAELSALKKELARVKAQKRKLQKQLAENLNNQIKK